MRFITIFLLSVLVISCETNSPITSPEIIPEPEQKVIYEPKEEVRVVEEKEEKEDNVEMGLGLIQGVIGLGLLIYAVYVLLTM